MSANPVGIGILGFGGFAMFAAQQFAQVPGAVLRYIAGTHREASLACAARFGLADVQRAEALFAMPDVQLVYIATPPFLHHQQARDALRAGKHVIVEKPLAVTIEHADELVSIARDTRLLLVTNLMQRYNPLFGQIKELIDSELLGDVLHGTFENYASDEGLGPDHWFWDRTKSGGIFVEHGVHFFDMFAGWLGEGSIESAGRVLRPGSGIEEQVYCTARFGDVPVTFYHGFTQAGRMDRQELRLLFERGDVTLREWIPTQAVVRTALDEAATRALASIFPGARIDVEDLYPSSERPLRARHKTYEAYQRITLTSAPATKM
ncbi:MAG TPA: Gfo/Idh/MocA family oxidoreductase, partial [Vicinamibacterales bacterium]|nr:Gfo/Idh/MocA family oxidoreductase [Vicinamibacterales bacterium]